MPKTARRGVTGAVPAGQNEQFRSVQEAASPTGTPCPPRGSCYDAASGNGAWTARAAKSAGISSRPAPLAGGLAGWDRPRPDDRRDMPCCPVAPLAAAAGPSVTAAASGADSPRGRGYPDATSAPRGEDHAGQVGEPVVQRLLAGAAVPARYRAPESPSRAPCGTGNRTWRTAARRTPGTQPSTLPRRPPAQRARKVAGARAGDARGDVQAERLPGVPGHVERGADGSHHPSLTRLRRAARVGRRRR